MKFRFVMLDPDDELPPHARQAGCEEEISRLSQPPPYQCRANDLVRNVRSANGTWHAILLANFHARIISDLLVDDGLEQTRRFVIEAHLEGGSLRFELPAHEFAGMRWVLPQLGPQAIIYPGQQQHVRAAIQALSGSVPPQYIRSHLGWRKEGSRWLYLHAGGALGAQGNVEDCQVRLRAPLDLYHLRPAASGDERIAAVRASLRLLETAPDRISLPLLAATYRAAWGAADFSVFMSGPSGSFKSSLAAVCQQHFGAGMDAGHLPAHFASTSNALEWLAFTAKDALLVVDDFAPTGGRDGELEQAAERLFRAAGNQQGRHRLGGGGRVGVPRPPRALVLATGEAVPPGESIRARMLVIEVTAQDINRQRLSENQRAGREGLLAAAMGAFVGWVAERYAELEARRRQRTQEIRDGWDRGGRHARTPAALAELQSGWEMFLQFAQQAGALDEAARRALEQRATRALSELEVRQTAYQGSADPASRFLAALQTALATERAHVADRQGRIPECAADWGWKNRPSGRGWTACGAQIGWVVGNDLYLDPEASFEIALQTGGNLAASQQQLRQCLRERGLLASMDVSRHILVVRRTLGGQPRKVLHLHSSQVRP